MSRRPWFSIHIVALHSSFNSISNQTPILRQSSSIPPRKNGFHLLTTRLIFASLTARHTPWRTPFHLLLRLTRHTIQYVHLRNRRHCPTSLVFGDPRSLASPNKPTLFVVFKQSDCIQDREGGVWGRLVRRWCSIQLFSNVTNLSGWTFIQVRTAWGILLLRPTSR